MLVCDPDFQDMAESQQKEFEREANTAGRVLKIKEKSIVWG